MKRPLKVENWWLKDGKWELCETLIEISTPEELRARFVECIRDCIAKSVDKAAAVKFATENILVVKELTAVEAALMEATQ